MSKEKTPKENSKQKAPKGKSKAPIVAVCILLVLAIVINVVCIQMFSAINTFMAANLNAKLPGAHGNVTAEQLTPEEAKEAALTMAETLTEEGIVLLENKGSALPLASGAKVNLFGYASISPLYGGTGSGASDASANTDLVTGLTNAGFEVNQDLVKFYQNSGVKRPDQSGFTGSNFTPAEVPASQYEDSLLQSAKSFSDVAIVMFSRIGGEGGDLPMDMAAAGYTDTGSRKYLELTQDESDLLDLIKQQGFGTVVVLINSSNAMELGFLEDDGIDAALWIGGPGSRGMNAVGKVLSGAVNPSGRLSDTYAYDHSTAPAYWNAGDFTYGNLPKRNYVEYVEGIYVGYRYYETRCIDNATGQCDEDAYQKLVQYPFGYGLSYTTFEQTIENFKADKGTITMDVKVTNTGTAAGKDVVQIYYTAPYTVGGIEKAHVVLAAFGKTGLLEAGQSETVSLSFAVEDMASYDENGAGCYVLEAGTYVIKLMKNAHEVIDSREYTVDQTITYGEGNARSTDKTAAVNRFTDVSTGQITQYVSRADWEGTTPTARQDGKDASQATVDKFSNPAVYEEDPSAQPITFASNGLTIEDMAGLPYDDPKWDRILEQLSINDMTNMIANGGWSTPEVASVGKPATNDLDGPAGINSLVSNLKGVSYPSEALIGASWNQDLLEQFGAVFGAEAVANHVVGLYAPAVNIHRTPYSGRNFEYYAEDALLSGKLGAAMVRGYASQGVYGYVKHFALNDQESNRLSLSVWSNEQAMRELYLKAFEIVVKEGKTTAIMSSYSNLGNTWAGGSHALLTEVLRDEWGFQGMVVTDSAMGNTGWMDVNLAIRAGGDMMLCLMGVNLDSSTNTAQQAMRRACHNILYTQANSAAVSAAADTSPYWLVLLVILDTVVVCAALFVFLRGKKLKALWKVLIVVLVAAVFTLIFWFCFFRSGGVAAADPNASAPAGSETPAETAAPTAAPTEAPSGPAGDIELTGNGLDEGAWLTGKIVLKADGTFSTTVTYSEEYADVEVDSGTWILEGGTLTLTGGLEYTTEVSGDTYTVQFVNAETSITVQVTGTAGGQSAPSGDIVLTGNGLDEGAWLTGKIVLKADGTFSTSVTYSEEYADVEVDSGTWSADGSTLTLTGGLEYTTEVSGNTYTVQFVNAETSITVQVTGTAQSAAAGGSVELIGSGEGENAWLTGKIALNADGTFSTTVTYSEEYADVPVDSGTWTMEGGALTLTGALEYTAEIAGDTCTVQFVNAETSIPVIVTGPVPASGSAAPAGDVELSGSGEGENAWLLGKILLSADGTFSTTVTYNEEYADIPVDSGTWSMDGGTLSLTGALEYTAEITGDTCTVQFINAETSIPVTVTGPVPASGSAAPAGDVELSGSGDGENAWLLGKILLSADGTFSTTVTYNEEYADIPVDSGTWTLDSGTLTLTGSLEYTAEVSGSTYTVQFVNAETGIPVTVSGTAG